MGILDLILGLFKGKEAPIEATDDLPSSDSVIVPVENIPSVPAEVSNIPNVPDSAYRKFRLTYYYVADQSKYTGVPGVPVYDSDKNLLAKVENGCFAAMSLEGTCKMRDGRLLNVAGKWVPVNHEDYAGVLDYHMKYLPNRSPGYSGISVKDGKVISALAFHVVPEEKIGKGYGLGQKGIPHDPFRTVAADMGTVGNSEPKWKGKGGICPPGTKVFIKEFVDMILPDGTIHNGIVQAIDTGGGIVSCHFDLFTGTAGLKSKVNLPSTVTVWYEGIEERVPVGYEKGLKL